MKIFPYPILPLVGAVLLAATPRLSAQFSETLASASPAAKPSNLSMTDKKIVKDVLEGAFFGLNLADRAKTKGRLEITKHLGRKMTGDINRMWSELTPVAQASGEKIPAELSGSDKLKGERLGKVEAQEFDKEMLKILTKETHRLAATLDTGSKTAQDPILKKICVKWAAPFKANDDLAEQAEKETVKPK